MLKEVVILTYILGVNTCALWNVVDAKPTTPRFIGSYKYLPGAGFYKLYKHKVTWGEAWEQCRGDNAHLLVIDSPEELKALKSVMIKERSHIGVHDLFLNTHYVTVTGKFR